MRGEQRNVVSTTRQQGVCVGEGFPRIQSVSKVQRKGDNRILEESFGQKVIFRKPPEGY